MCISLSFLLLLLLKMLHASAGTETADSAETKPDGKCAIKPNLMVKKHFKAAELPEYSPKVTARDPFHLIMVLQTTFSSILTSNVGVAIRVLMGNTYLNANFCTI